MAIGIGLHCWYCDHGPCTGDCKEDFKQQDMKNKKWISLLNFEGDIFKAVKRRNELDTFDIVDYKGNLIREGINSDRVFSIYNGSEKIRTSEGRLYDISKEHPEAKPTEKEIRDFLGIAKKESKKGHKSRNFSISFELNDKQQAQFDEWCEAIKKIHGDYGNFKWTISPTGIGDGIEVWSSLTKTSLDLTDMDSW